MNKEKRKREYDSKASSYNKLMEEVRDILKEKIKNKGIKYENIEGRVKGFDSLFRKMEHLEEIKPSEKIKQEDIHDITGLRVVCLFLNDIKRIVNIIHENFDVLEEDNKIDNAEVSSFGYMSVHFIARLKQSYSGPRYDNIKDLNFEIQVRTIAMHAWASISHYLDYKTENDVPTSLKRDFQALSGLFYVADVHFEMFYTESAKTRKKIEQDFKKHDAKLDVEINLDTMTAFLRERFPSRKRTRADEISDLVKLLRQTRYSSMQEVAEHVDNFSNNALSVEKRFAQSSFIDFAKFNELGFLYIILDIADEKIYNIRSRKSSRLESDIFYSNLIKNEHRKKQL